MAIPEGVSDETLIESYRRLGSVNKVAVEVGWNRGSVHRRLQNLGIKMEGNGKRFADADMDRLRRDYQRYRDEGKLRVLAAEMGRTVPFLARKARALGFTDRGHAKPYASVWKYMSEDEARRIFDDFKASSFGLGVYCERKGYDSLGFWRKMTDLWPDEYEFVIESKVPKTSMYRRGRVFEYRTRDALTKLDYFVLRSPASKSPTDLVAIKKGRVLFVQCKLSAALGVQEWNALYDLAVSVGAIPVLASRPKGRGVDFERLTDRKDGTKRRQPKEPYEPC